MVSGEKHSTLTSALHTGVHTTQECNLKTKDKEQMNKHEKIVQ